ncbi:DUF3618 domain-containing protein [Sphaerisporangium album]|uniref:DUF3618 domain-containing protein n=2 Tax=Sphaerisporangium album TaxID=509200 RepID=A0A367F9B5_9ACTN|nr:DUF3618 domain-containing protein [Sphaerisporangium album]
MGQSLNVPQVHAPPKPYVKPVVSHGRGDPLAGLSESSLGPRPEAPPEHPHQEYAHHPPVHWSEEDRLRDEIYRTREELGLTVEALAQKVDVKARARRTMAATRQKASGMADRLRGANAERAGTAAMPGTVKSVAYRVTDEARRRPAVLIAVGAATMIGVGWVNLTRRRPPAGLRRRYR